MSKETNENKPLFTPELPEGLEDNNNLSNTIKPEIVTLQDGTQILKDVSGEEVEEEFLKEEISDKDLLKLLQFTKGIKTATPEELNDLRNDEKELERLIRVSIVKSRNFNYNPKKKFGAVYKKERQRKNRMAKASRRINR